MSKYMVTPNRKKGGNWGKRKEITAGLVIWIYGWIGEHREEQALVIGKVRGEELEHRNTVVKVQGP